MAALTTHIQDPDPVELIKIRQNTASIYARVEAYSELASWSIAIREYDSIVLDAGYMFFVV